MSFIMTTLKDKDGNPIRDEYGNAVYDSVRLILQGKKTQTRRVRKDTEKLEIRDGKKTVVTYSDRYPNGRIKWQVGRDYAVKPKRSMPAVWYRLRDTAQKLMDENHGAEIELAHDTLYADTTWLEHAKASTSNWINAQHYLELRDFEPLRIRLTNIESQVLRDITWDDCFDEGIKYISSPSRMFWFYDYEINQYRRTSEFTAHESYKTLLEATNGGTSVGWDLPVWKIDFEVMRDAS